MGRKTTSPAKSRSRKLIENRTEIRGSISKLYYAKNGWCAGKLESTEGKIISFSGAVMVAQGQPVIMTGNWENDPKYGRQFVACMVDLDTQLDAHGLAKYLSNNPDFKNIGPVKAATIAEHFGLNFEDALLNRPEEISKVGKLPMKDVLAMQSKWTENRSVHRLMSTMAAFELTYKQSIKIIGAYGNAAADVVRKNPYCLIDSVEGFGFKRVDIIALRAGVKKNNPARLEAGILAAINESLNWGSTWMSKSSLLAQANKLLILDDMDSGQQILAAFNNLLTNGNLRMYEIVGASDPAVAIASVGRNEERIATILRDILAHNERPQGKHLIDKELDNFSSLESNQRKAVENAFRYAISVVCGGAGCGKTYLTNAICNIANRRKNKRGESNDITLLSPTGKAAQRLSEATGMDASTIHRGIGYKNGKFNLDESTLCFDDTIISDFVIVDESSMVDIEMFLAILIRIDFSKTNLILVGDPFQLPSVGPGAILRDIILAMDELATAGATWNSLTKLDVCMRQAGTLKENANHILRGVVKPTVVREKDALGDWYVFNGMSTPTSVCQFLERVYRNLIPNELPFDLIKDVQVLTPVHAGPCGTMELNRKLQVVVQRKVYGVAVPAQELDAKEKAKPAKPMLGDKVIQTKNDYNLDLMNGTIGVLRAYDPCVDGTIVFDNNDNVYMIFEAEDGRRKPLTKDDMDTIELAYAMTIHKAQGSEFPCVFVVVHKAHGFVHDRNLLYTAVTRARKMTAIVGDAWGINHCASSTNRTAMAKQRSTLLGLWLCGKVKRIETHE